MSARNIRSECLLFHQKIRIFRKVTIVLPPIIEKLMQLFMLAKYYLFLNPGFQYDFQKNGFRAGARVRCSTGLLISTVHASGTLGDRYTRAKSERLGWARANLQTASCRDTKTSHSETWASRLGHLGGRKYFFVFATIFV